MTERAIVTFNNPKTGQKIIINLTNDLDLNQLDVNVKFDPIPNSTQDLGLIGFLSGIFLKSLPYDDPTELSSV